MIVLALDPSTKNTGIAVFKDQELIYHNCINAGSQNLFRRIDKMIEGIEAVIKEYKPTHVAIEDPIPEDVQHNQNTYKALMYLQAFIMYYLDKYKITNIKFFTSSEWRKKCGIKTGRGIRRESLKLKDIAFVKSQFGIKVNDDEADAIGIGFAAVGGVIKEPQIIIDDSGFEFA